MRRIVRFEVTIPVDDLPEDWKDDMVLFHFNEGSWCASNLIGLLEKVDSADPGLPGCLCPCVEASLLTEEEEQEYMDLNRNWLEVEQ